MKNIIQSTSKLNEYCERLKKYPFITIDTEFIREKTYWPELCLIQVASADEAACIDPLAEDIDLSSLFDLLQNPDVVKVFHAARQDIEIFYNLTGKTPTPLFDTQVAAMVCGFGESISYQHLVLKLAGVELDKSMRFTDWKSRPLTDRQIDYALADVTYLQDVYLGLKELSEETGRLEWVKDEMMALSSPCLYENKPENAWKKLRLHNLRPYVLAICKEMATYREAEAQRLNRPRKHIMRDETLFEVSMNAPESIEDLEKMRGLANGFAKGRIGKEIIKIVQKVKAQDPETYPVLPTAYEMPRTAKTASKMLRLLLMIKAAENDVAEKLITTLDDLDLLAAKEKPDVPALKGWRYDVFGKDALALKAGKLGFRYDPHSRRVKVFPVD